MTLPSTNAEWETLISQIRDSLPDSPSALQASVTPNVNRTIDHTLLSLQATEDEIDNLCAQAVEHQFATVCVRLNYVPRAVEKLAEAPDVGVACVVGFPEGIYETSDKEEEARAAVAQGATELDMVLKYPLLKTKQYTDIYTDVLGVRNVAPAPVKLKVILETSQLTRDEIIAGSVIACVAGAAYIKTSTGFLGGGATVENVALMYVTAGLVGKGTKVKASGGVRSAEDCINMLKAGADRIGASSGVKIMQGLGGGEGLEKDAQNSAY